MPILQVHCYPKRSAQGLEQCDPKESETVSRVLGCRGDVRKIQRRRESVACCENEWLRGRKWARTSAAFARVMSIHCAFQEASREAWAWSRSQAARFRPAVLSSISLDFMRVARANPAKTSEGCINDRSSGLYKLRTKSGTLTKESQ